MRIIRSACAVMLLLALTVFAALPTMLISALDSADAPITHQDLAPREEKEALSGETIEALSFSCIYDANTKKLTLSGSMDHSAFIKYANAEIAIYVIPPGRSEDEVIKDPNSRPLAQGAASMNFSFSFKLSSFIDKYSRYAVFLVTENDEYILATRAQYPEVTSPKDTSGVMNIGFKGILSSDFSLPAKTDADTVLLPIYIDRLYTTQSSGYIYQGEEGQVFFDRSYIDSIDAKLNSICVTGAAVCLQFLLRGSERLPYSAEDEAEVCFLPDVYDLKTLYLIHSMVDFLLSRYANDEEVRISGIIAGKAWNEYSAHNSSSVKTLDEYVQKCGLYAVVLANSARSVIPNIDVIIPLSAADYSDDASYSGVGGRSFSVRDILEGLLKYFGDSFKDGLDFSILMETETVPFGISNDSVSSGIDQSFSDYSSNMYAGGQSGFSDYLLSLSERYTKVSKDYIFLWRVPKNLEGTALASAYAYSFYVLKSDKKIKSFVVAFEPGDLQKPNDILNVFKYIDTSKGNEYTKSLLELFGISAWELLPGINGSNFGTKLVMQKLPTGATLPSDIKGSFRYFDFSSISALDGWRSGIGCSNIKFDYDKYNQKGMRANLSFSEDSGRTGEIVYVYSEAESIAFTPYLDIALCVDDNFDGSMYEVSVLCEGDISTYESSHLLKGNEAANLILDFSRISEVDRIRTIRLSLKPLSSDGEASTSATLWLYEISGHSKKHDSEALTTYIEAERNKNKKDQAIYSGTRNILKRVTAGIAVLVIGLLMMIFRAVWKRIKRA